MQDGIDLILKQQYTAARQHFRRVAERYTNTPEGYLFQAAALQAQAIDFRQFIDKEQFDSLLDVTRSVAETMIADHPASPWGYYYRGTALGMESYDKMQRGEFLSGYVKGRSAVSSLEKALELDSTFYDAYAVLGTYYYWKSRKTEFLHWLPFVRDDRRKGIEYLRRVVEKGRYQRLAALSNLLWVYIDASEFQQAEALARRALQQYPRHRIFLNGWATALHQQNKYAEALEAYERLLRAIQEDAAPNGYNEVACRVNILSIKASLHDTTQYREHLAALRLMQQRVFPPYLRQKVEEKFQQARQLEKLFSSGKLSSQ
jgi:tetratricopeptide (TPR) repeat protein